MSSMLRNLTNIFILMLIVSPVWAADEEEEKAPPEIGYVEIKPSIVSNLTGGPKYMRCNIQLMTEQASRIPDIEVHIPALRHTILMQIAREDGKALQGRDGKEALRKSLLNSLKKTLQELAGEELIKDLYFTAYYVK